MAIVSEQTHRHKEDVLGLVSCSTTIMVVYQRSRVCRSRLCHLFFCPLVRGRPHTRQNGLSALRASSIELRTGVSQVKVEPVKDTIIESNPKNY